MATYTTSGNTFVNPYNFVSLERECYKIINYEDRKKQGNLTGWIDCSIEALTQIFIPNTTSVQEDEEGKKYSHVFDEAKTINSYDFYSYTNLKGVKNPQEPKPVIPGSEIRGMIRSAFEAVTNSCLSTIDDEQKLYKRVTSPAKPGQLVFQDNEWKIVECRRYRLPKSWIRKENGRILINGEQYTEGESVFVRINYKSFKVIKISRKWEKDLRKGLLHIGEYNENKNYESVFILHSDRKSNEIIEKRLDQNFVPEMLNGLIENIFLYRTSVNKTEAHRQYDHLDIKSISNLTAKFITKEMGIDEFNHRLQQKDFKIAFNYLNGAAIYFVNHGGKYYLSPAAIGREVFYKKLTDIIGSFKPCDNLKQLCQACALFGLARKNEAAASRVRFTDALISGKPEYENHQTLKELASPKLSATEFYLKRPEQAPDLWNYDYAGNWKNKKWDDVKGYTPEIRGRKFYWHQKNSNPFLGNGDKSSERNVHVRPLKKGAMFTFRVYFNDVSKEELNKLLWVLEIGGKEENAHKIGMGKPIGMGSVKIQANSVKIRDIRIEDGIVKYDTKAYDKPSYADIETALVNPDILKEFLKITNFQEAPENVKYPCNDDSDKVSDKVYEWFMANKQIGRGTGTSPVIHQTLPEIGKPYLQSYSDISKKKTIILERFSPLFLTVRNIGPFFEKPVVFDFTDANDGPCNFYLLIAGNGAGKTTVLELMAFLMKMLEYDRMESFGHDGLDKNYGSVQWDILIKFKERFQGESDEEFREKKEKTIVLSLLAGSFEKSVISEWDSDRLKNFCAASCHQFGFWRNESGRLERLGQNDSFVNEFLNEIKINSDTQPREFENPTLTTESRDISIVKKDTQPREFENPTLTLPTLLYFSAYRNIPSIADKNTATSPENWKPVDWEYKCIRQIAQEGSEWRKSLDNLFMWLENIDNDFFKSAKNTVNERVFKGREKFFKGMQKNPPEAVIYNKGREHSFDKLSSGEKSLLQLFSCIGVYMTRNTILLIDEMDVHLHSKWQHRVLNLLKKLVKDHPGLTVIATTHSREILSAFAYEIKEDKLRKGGYIIEEEL